MRDLTFLLYEVDTVERLTRYARFAEHGRETFDAALGLAQRLADERFAPHWRKADQQEPHVVDGQVRLVPEVKGALEAYGQAGFFAPVADVAEGGMQLPLPVAQACEALFLGANVATASYALLARGVANLIEAHGSAEQKRLYLGPLRSGRFLGTMCLSEPQAGSSLADITTQAEPAGDGSYRLRGSKMWISGGEHELAENIIHMVLARVPGGPPGVRGISLFLVPRFLLNDDGSPGERNDVLLAGLNHKMGYRGIVNTALSFGERGACVGYLVGAPHQGLPQMFHMMNEARIGVGLGAVMIGRASYRYALGYARERRQGRHPDQKDPSSAPVALIEHADVRRMLLQQKSYVEGALGLALYAAGLVDQQRLDPGEARRREAGLLLDLLTPIVKAWSADWCTRASDLAIQVLGGYGYSRDYPVEQLYRDNRLNAIHEGTNGIQALDLLGRKAMQGQGEALGLLLGAIEATAAEAAAIEALAPLGDELRRHASLLAETTRALGLCMLGGQIRLGLANASHYMTLAGHVVVAWMWLRQALAAQRGLGAAHGGGSDFYRGKLQTCRFFFAHELPTIEPLAALLQRLDRTALDMQVGWFLARRRWPWRRSGWGLGLFRVKESPCKATPRRATCRRCRRWGASPWPRGGRSTGPGS